MRAWSNVAGIPLIRASIAAPFAVPSVPSAPSAPSAPASPLSPFTPFAPGAPGAPGSPLGPGTRTPEAKSCLRSVRFLMSEVVSVEFLMWRPVIVDD